MGRYGSLKGVLSITLLLSANLGCCWGQSRGDRPMVQFFSEENFEALVWERELDQVKETECINLPESAMEQDFKSVKTQECIMLYNVPDCQKPFGNKRYSIYSKILEENQANFTFSENRKVASFHMCNQDQGANAKVNVDFYDDKGTPFPDAQFKDVCSCKNLPNSVKTARASEMDNHGHCIKIFCDEGCQGSSKEIPPGFNHHSQIMRIMGTLDKRGCNRPSSFQPCEPTQCSRLHVTVYKMEFRNSSQLGELQVENVDMNTKMEFSNPGNTPVFREFEAEEIVEELVEFSVAEDIPGVYSVEVDAEVELESEKNVPVVNCKKFQSKLKNSYNYQKKRGQDKGKITRVSQSREIEVEQKVEVKACSEVSISAVVKMVKEFPIEYTAWARISGETEGKVMTSQEIQRRLVGGKTVFLKEVGENGAEVKFNGVMKATYAASSEVLIDGKGIQKCLEENVEVTASEEDLYLVVEAEIEDDD